MTEVKHLGEAGFEWKFLVSCLRSSTSGSGCMFLTNVVIVDICARQILI